MAKHNHKLSGCTLTSVPGYTGETWRGKKLGKICSNDPDEIAFAKYVGAQIRVARAKRMDKAA